MLYHIEVKSVSINRDITFREQLFPFQEKEIPDHNFPLVSPFVCDTYTLTNWFHESTNADQYVVSPVDPISLMNLPHEDITLLCWRSPLQN